MSKSQFVALKQLNNILNRKENIGYFNKNETETI